MPEYTEDIEYIDQYNINDTDEVVEETEKNIIWSLEYSKLCERLMDIFEFHREIDPRFEYIGIDSLYTYKKFHNINYRSNNKKGKDFYLLNLCKDIHEEIQLINNKLDIHKDKYKFYRDSEYEDFKELIKLIDYTEKNIYNILFNELKHYIIF